MFFWYGYVFGLLSARGIWSSIYADKNLKYCTNDKEISPTWTISGKNCSKYCSVTWKSQYVNLPLFFFFLIGCKCGGYVAAEVFGWRVARTTVRGIFRCRNMRNKSERWSCEMGIERPHELRLLLAIWLYRLLVRLRAVTRVMWQKCCKKSKRLVLLFLYHHHPQLGWRSATPLHLVTFFLHSTCPVSKKNTEQGTTTQDPLFEELDLTSTGTPAKMLCYP